MKNEHRVLLGWRGGRLYGVDEVSSGLACNCLCPACKSPLIARKGRKVRHHFSHYQRNACVWANETALHLLAKSVLERAYSIKTPAVFIPRYPEALSPIKTHNIRRVWCERRYGQQRPDLAVVFSNGQWLNIEIAVTHFTPAKKVTFYRKRHWNAIEIDCSDLVDYPGNREALTRHLQQRLLYGTDHKKWLYHHGQALFLRKLQQLAERRKVRHYLWGQRHFYNVYGCPQQKRHRKTVMGKTVPYASLTQDCWHCPYLLCQQVDASGEHLIPQSILCWGHLQYIFDQEQEGE